MLIEQVIGTCIQPDLIMAEKNDFITYFHVQQVIVGSIFTVGIIQWNAVTKKIIQIGEQTTYTVRITNQGNADDTNVKMVVTFPKEITPVSAVGGTVSGQSVSFPAVPRLAPKQAVSYSIRAKGAAVGDARVKFTLTTDELKAPVIAEESTTVY